MSTEVDMRSWEEMFRVKRKAEQGSGSRSGELTMLSIIGHS